MFPGELITKMGSRVHTRLDRWSDGTYRLRKLATIPAGYVLTVIGVLSSEPQNVVVALFDGSIVYVRQSYARIVR